MLFLSVVNRNPMWGHPCSFELRIVFLRVMCKICIQTWFEFVYKSELVLYTKLK